MRQLIHNGVLIPKPYEAKGFQINVKGNPVKLTASQEEMAVAWVKKLETDYVKDPVFVKNFFKDFLKELGIQETLRPEDFDFSDIQRYVEREKEIKLAMSKEEKKRLAESRKVIREANKEQYGHATVDGVKVELGNYVVEPPSIFMGRGKHPLRGLWKRGATESDITLNISPDAPTPKGNWKERVWQPNSMWIARWDDKLRGREKYLWLADTSPVKQQREIKKFEKASKLSGKMEAIQRHIQANLKAENIKRRKLATVSYLIERLKLRVGDEKDKDEADTVGATTLRPEHIKLNSDTTVTFDFLGKDSVRWKKTVTLDRPVVENLSELLSEANSPLFKGVRSEGVNQFLGEIVPGLTAKVFRTYHATNVVKAYLKGSDVHRDEPDYEKKYVATMANLQAAELCHHKKKLPKKWHENMEKKKERMKKLRAKGTPKSLERLKELQFRVKALKATKDYNINTSLKSYIDPRVYYEWGQRLNYDWKLYYTKTMQRKFSWVESEK